MSGVVDALEGKKETQAPAPDPNYLKEAWKLPDRHICLQAANHFDKPVKLRTNHPYYKKYIVEARRRSLDCTAPISNFPLGQITGYNGEVVVSGKQQTSVTRKKTSSAKSEPETFANKSDKEICRWAVEYDSALNRKVWRTKRFFEKYVAEAKARSLQCLGTGTEIVNSVDSDANGVLRNQSSQVSSSTGKGKSNFSDLWESNGGTLLAPKTTSKTEPIGNRVESSPVSSVTPRIRVVSQRVEGRQAIIDLNLTNHLAVAEMTVNGEVIDRPAASVTWRGYAPIGLSQVVVELTDVSGITTKEYVTVERTREVVRPDRSLPPINPFAGPVATNTNNALAIIIGIDTYQNVGAAPFAERDASFFYDVVQEKLGIPTSNIKLLLGEEASYLNILEVTREWVRKSNLNGEADIYLFYAGHGRTNESGETAYLLPFNVKPSLIEVSSIELKSTLEGIADTTSGKVVAFIDACYSGSTRSGESLVAGRPLITVKKQEIGRSNLTIFSASDNDQIAKVLDEAQHGAFSYFLLRALTGNGDQNGDGTITSAELNSYLVGMVGRRVENQTPQVSGANWFLELTNR